MSTPAAATPSSDLTHPSNTGTTGTASDLTPLERGVLAEYAQLRSNLDTLSRNLSALASNPSPQIVDTLRLLERKASLVHTALKASVYGIVLQQTMMEDGQAQEQEQE